MINVRLSALEITIILHQIQSLLDSADELFKNENLTETAQYMPLLLSLKKLRIKLIKKKRNWEHKKQ